MQKIVPKPERREQHLEFPVDLRILTGQIAMFRYQVNALVFAFQVQEKNGVPARPVRAGENF